MDVIASPASPKHPLPWKALIILGSIVVLIALAGVGAYLYTISTPFLLKSLQSAYDRNELDSALTLADAALAKHPGDASLLTMKAHILAQKGVVEYKEEEFGAQAVAVAEQAIAADPTYSEAERALGVAYAVQQDFAKAHAAYAKALELDPKNARALSGDAHAYYMEGETEQAEAAYTSALAIDPSLDVAHVGLGRILLAKKDGPGAFAEFKTAYQNTKNVHEKAVTASALAEISSIKGDFTEAKTYATEATTLDPKYAQGWYSLGKVIFSARVVIPTATTTPLSDTSQSSQPIYTSLELLNTSVGLDSTLSNAYVQIGIEQFFLGQAEVGATFLDRAVQAVPSDATLSATEKAELLVRIAKTRTELTNIAKPKKK